VPDRQPAIFTAVEPLECVDAWKTERMRVVHEQLAAIHTQGYTLVPMPRFRHPNRDMTPHRSGD
jgi:hypothetical protein